MSAETAIGEPIVEVTGLVNRFGRQIVHDGDGSEAAEFA